MTDFNNPIRQAGIRKMIRHKISKGLIQATKAIRETTIEMNVLSMMTDIVSYKMEKLIEPFNWIIYEDKIRFRIRIFEFINRGILKLWIGG